MATSKLRVNVFANDPALRGSGGGKCLIIPAGAAWDAVLASAGAKLGFGGDDGGVAVKRLFTANGAEVEAVDEIMPNDVLYVSRGEDFGQSSATKGNAPAAATASPPPGFPWTCTVCTFHNEAHRAACEICAADPPLVANDGSAGQPKPVSFIGRSSAPAADAAAVLVVESQAAEAEPLPLFLRRVRAPVLPGEEEEDDNERSDEEGGSDDEEWTDDEDDLWCDFQEYEDYRLAMQLQAEIAKENAAKKDEEENGLYECPICYDDKPLPQMYFIEGCFHRFCMECIKMHLEVAIKEGSLAKKTSVEEPTDGNASAANDVGIACPGNGCTNIISYNDVRHCATGILFEKFESIVFSRAVDGSKDLKWCPQPGCGNAIFRSARDGKLAECSNSACGHTFCFECGEENHEEFSDCSTYAEYLREAERTGEQRRASSISAMLAFHDWARTQDLRFCPQCQELIEKNMGCDHMYCTKCKTHFNWSEAVSYDVVSKSKGLSKEILKTVEAKIALKLVDQARRPLFKPKRRRRKAARRAGLVKPQQPIPGIATTSTEILYRCPSCSSTKPLLRNIQHDQLYCSNCSFHIDSSLRLGLTRIISEQEQARQDEENKRKRRGR